MTGRRPPFLAVVEPLAARAILQDSEQRLKAYARRAVSYERSPQLVEQGRQIQRALEMLRESARQWRQDQAPVHHVVEGGAEEWLSTAEAAEILGVTARQVLNLIDKGRGPLPAVPVKGAWRIRREDLDDFRRSRSEAAG